MDVIKNKKITLTGVFILSLLAFALSPALVNAASLAGASQGTKAKVNFMPYAKEFNRTYSLVYGDASVNNYVPPVYSASVLDPYAASRSLQSLVSTSFYRLYLNAWSLTPADCTYTDPAAFGLKTTTNKCVNFTAKNTLTGESFANPGFVYSTSSSINWSAVVGVILVGAAIFFAPALIGTTWAAIGSSIASGYAAMGVLGQTAVQVIGYGAISRVTAP